VLKHLARYNYTSKNLGKKNIFFPTTNARNLSCPKIYQNHKPPNPSTVHFPKLHFHQPRKINHETWPKIYPNTAFQILCDLDKRIYGAFHGISYLLRLLVLIISIAFHVAIFPTIINHLLLI
jgi:hypothetical protein